MASRKKTVLKKDLQKLNRLSRRTQTVAASLRRDPTSYASAQPNLDDPDLAAVLRVHLFVERALYEWCEISLPHGERLESARLSFPQLLVLADAASPVPLGNWLVIALRQLNAMRNRFAHRLDVTERTALVTTFIRHVAKKQQVAQQLSTEPTLSSALLFLSGAMEGLLVFLKEAKKVDAFETLHRARKNPASDNTLRQAV